MTRGTRGSVISAPHLGPLDSEPGWRSIVPNQVRHLSVTRLWKGREVVHQKWHSPLAVAVTVVVLVWAGWYGLNMARGAIVNGDIATDFWVYRDNGARFLETGELYFPEQIAGPHPNVFGHSVYYPPSALLVIVPVSLLPVPLAVLAWWGIPLLIVGYCLYRLRPAPWTWPVMALLLAWPRSIGAIVYGNTDMWIMSAIAGATVWGWPAVFVLLKPSLAPFALLGIRRRSWWFAMLILGAVSLAFLPLWFDYLTVIRNAHGIGWWYSLLAVPLLLVPLVAWLGRDAVALDARVEYRLARERALEPDHL